MALDQPKGGPWQVARKMDDSSLLPLARHGVSPRGARHGPGIAFGPPLRRSPTIPAVVPASSSGCVGGLPLLSWLSAVGYPGGGGRVTRMQGRRCNRPAVVMALGLVLVAGCGGPAPTPSRARLQPFVPYQTLHIVAPTPTIKPTPIPEPTWTLAQKGHFCSALAALEVAKTEGTAAYSAAEADQWTQVLSHAKRVQSQAQIALDEFDAAHSSRWMPSADAVAGLAEMAQEYWDAAHEVVWDMENQLPLNVIDVSPLGMIGLLNTDSQRLDYELGGC
jgi:hypothetical protein